MTQAIMLDTPEAINAFMLASLRGRLRLEIKGMKCKGPSALAIAKKRFPGIKTREEALEKISAILG